MGIGDFAENKTFAGDGFTPEFDGVDESAENADASAAAANNLWECSAGSPEEWLKGWEGRQETHDMIHNSYD